MTTPHLTILFDNYPGLPRLKSLWGFAALIRLPARPSCSTRGAYADAAAIDRTIRALQDLGVTHVVPTHCTGDTAKAAFLRAFGAHCLEGGVGREIRLVGRGRLYLEPLPEV